MPRADTAARVTEAATKVGLGPSLDRKGEAVTASVDPARTSLFDHQTGARVRGNAPPGFAS